MITLRKRASFAPSLDSLEAEDDADDDNEDEEKPLAWRSRVYGTCMPYAVDITPEAVCHLPQECRVVVVRPLLRELLLYAITLPPLYALDSPEERLMTVLLDQLQHIK
jgi:hypothetical protein